MRCNGQNTLQLSEICRMETSKLYNYEDFTRLPRRCYLLCGYEVIDTNRTRQSKLMLQIYHLVCVCCHICAMFLTWRSVINWKNSENYVIFWYCAMISYSINSEIKYLTSLQKVSIKSLNDKLAQLYPQSTQEKIDCRVEDYFWSSQLKTLIVSYIGSTILAAMGPLFHSVYIYLTENHFPYMFCSPCFSFNPEQDPLWHYFLFYIVDCLHGILAVIANITTDLWLVCFEKQICMHFDYIARLLEEYQPHHTHDIKDREFLSQLVKKHIQLMEIQEDINKIFGDSLLFSILTTAGVFCAVSIHSIVQGLNLSGITFLIFLVTASAQFYLVCYFGEQVNILSTGVAFAAYSQNWHNASPTYKKYLLMIIIRAQRPVELSAMGYLPVTVDTFQLVMTVSYRVIALVRQFIE